ncbi:MAG TPA: glutamate-cysteine ligase family protein [Jiangellales bacterium]|nr:glutamate-cysteine ligase family protein [Jiangellales bacterium]
MGQEVERREFTREDRQRYRAKVHRCLDVLAQMLGRSSFDFERPHVGLEIELNLVDEACDPAMRNAEVLDLIADEVFQTELGQFNLEINMRPVRLIEQGLTAFESGLRESLNDAESKARTIGAHMVIVGILPTLGEEHLGLNSLSANPRYELMNEQIFAARGEDLHLTIEGPERLDTFASTILPEAACTSTQFHLQVSPEEFAAYWNASQCLAAVQVALGANSPYCFGKEVWRETRIALFEQATDTRSDELKAQGVRPRVWFGERWITSIWDLFEENARYFPALLPICDDEDPVAVLEAGGTPSLNELRLHNGTIWRWNRPVYDVVDGTPHLRVENRVLPAGPTIVDTLANGALYYGAVTTLAQADRPLWSQLSFATAEENFHVAARDGIDAKIFWPGLGEVPVTELVLRRLLALAQDGLERWGVTAEERDRLLGIIEQRCLTHRNGAAWQVDTVHRLEAAGKDRQRALHQMLQGYIERMHSNEPVHAWPD